MACAVSYGVNMLLTPLFTPPLDTAVGGERTCVQLIDVILTEDGSYQFGFDRLEQWISLCDKCGVRYLEFSHLFTQWGAAHAPKSWQPKPPALQSSFRSSAGHRLHWRRIPYFSRRLPACSDEIHPKASSGKTLLFSHFR